MISVDMFFNSFGDHTTVPEDRSTVISWSRKGKGMGNIIFFMKDGKLMCDSEMESKETIKKILCEMVDEAEFVK